MAKNYIARIAGVDEKYGLKRDFLPFEVPQNLKAYDYQAFISSIAVEDGLYELGTGYNNKYKDIVKVENGIVSSSSKNEALLALGGGK
jgi:hypothetical protein